MLVKIECEKFAAEHTEKNDGIVFNPGLNTVLGSSGGSNAIGKSTFLWIVDYAFGGENYCNKTSDIKEVIGSHTIFFAFIFDGEYHYFYRNTDDPKRVFRCDSTRHTIGEPLKLDEYRQFLYSEYKIGLPNIEFSEIAERYFRIYGRDNTYERYPLHIKPREKDENAVDFLMRLFGHNRILLSIQNMLDEMGITVAQLKYSRRQQVDTEKIEQNEEAIKALEKRLQEQMQKSTDAQMMDFGFDTQTFEQIEAARKELKTCVRRRNRLQSQLNAIQENIAVSNPDAVSEFDSLLHFFPNAGVKAFEEIEYFHKRLREILGEEMTQEIERLRPLIARCDNEIKRLQKKIEDSGLVREMSERAISQCVSISRRIDELKDETAELEHQLELQQTRTENERRLTNLLNQQVVKIDEIQEDVTFTMGRINSVITDGLETAPVLRISPQKEISFETPGNTSEGTAYKSLVIYDLTILELRAVVPALIHDSNILKRIEDAHLEHILTKYQESGKQIFIAYDKADSSPAQAQKILEETAILRLSDGHELFGISWSKHEAED